MLATILQMPQLIMPDDKARGLASALIEYQKYHPLPSLSPERMALAALVWAVGNAYGPMAVSIYKASSGDHAGAGAAPQSPAFDAGENVSPFPAKSAADWFKA